VAGGEWRVVIRHVPAGKSDTINENKLDMMRDA
jgi:hypothetical protein